MAFVDYGSTPKPGPQQRRAARVAVGLALFAGLTLTVLLVSHAHVSSPSLTPTAASLSSVPSSMSRDMGPDVDPCKDFQAFSCEGFTKRAKIPDDELEWARAWDTTIKKNRDKMRSVVEGDAGPVGTYFASCMDQERIHQRGVQPLVGYLLAVDSADDLESLQRVITLLHSLNVVTFFDWDVVADPLHPGTNAVNLLQGGLTLPAKSYYLKPEHQKARIVYLKAIADTLVATGIDPVSASSDAKRVLEIETTIARMFMKNDQARGDMPKGYSMDEVDAMAPNLNFPRFFKTLSPQLYKHVGIEKKNILLIDKQFYAGVSNLVKSHSAEYFKPYLRFRLAYTLGADLTPDFLDAGLELSKALMGVKKILPRWRKCLNSVSTALGDTVGKLYVDKFFTESHRRTALEMLGHTKAIFRSNLGKVEWMDETTRQHAQKKLDAMLFEVGYPEHYTQYNYSVHRDYFFENTIKARKDEVTRTLLRLGQGVDRHRWGSTSPTDVDAFYSRQLNTLFVPAGILQPPFFDPDYDMARNYGAIGAVMGHEMTHGFDDVGRKFDWDGQLVNWWKPTDKAAFKRRSQCMARQYSHYTVSGHHVDGNLTLGEAIADEGGLKLAFQALTRAMALKNGYTPNHAHYNPDTASAKTQAEEAVLAKALKSGVGIKKAAAAVMDAAQHQAVAEIMHSREMPLPPRSERQLFFLSWGQTWCSVTRTAAEVLELHTDEHAPDKFRVIGPLSESADFAQAFSCPAGSPMNPAHRCELW